MWCGSASASVNRPDIGYRIPRAGNDAPVPRIRSISGSWEATRTGRYRAPGMRLPRPRNSLPPSTCSNGRRLRNARPPVPALHFLVRTIAYGRTITPYLDQGSSTKKLPKTTARFLVRHWGRPTISASRQNNLACEIEMTALSSQVPIRPS